MAALACLYAWGGQLKMDNIQAFQIANNFLAKEAKLLDERRFDEWFDMLDDDILYHIPIREARLDYDQEWTGGAYRIRDDKGLIKVRIDRLKSGHAWAETPPSRTLRVVGSVLVDAQGDDEITVESAILIYRQRGHDAPGEVVPARREDVLRIKDGKVTLLRRTARITEVLLTTPNLNIFI